VKHSRRSDPELSMEQGDGKVFPRAADQCIGRAAGFRRKHVPSPAATENRLPWRKPAGGNSVEIRSPLRMQFHPRPRRDPSRTCARESAPGKGSHRTRLPRPAISSSRKGRFSGIANRPDVIRGWRANIKKVYGNRYFPIDTMNTSF